MGCHVVSLQNSTHYGLSLCLPTEQYTLWAVPLSPYRTVHTMGRPFVSLQNSTHYGPSLCLPYRTVHTMGCPFVSLQNSTHYRLPVCLPTEQYTLWAVPLSPYRTVHTMGCPFVSLQNSAHYGLSLCLPTEQYTLWAVPLSPYRTVHTMGCPLLCAHTHPKDMLLKQSEGWRLPPTLRQRHAEINYSFRWGGGSISGNQTRPSVPTNVGKSLTSTMMINDTALGVRIHTHWIRITSLPQNIFHVTSDRGRLPHQTQETVSAVLNSFAWNHLLHPIYRSSVGLISHLSNHTPRHIYRSRVR